VNQSGAGTEVSTEPDLTGRSPERNWALVITLAMIAAVATVAVVRLTRYGFARVADDEASYIDVGRSLLRLKVPHNRIGDVYTIRSWAYPALLGGASDIVHGDVFLGPRLLVAAFGIGSLAGALALSYRLARAIAAVATALAILATPLIWTVLRTTHIDVALMFFVVVLLLILWKPSPRRFVLGGIWLGLTLLIKETAAPMILLPCAWIGIVPAHEWRRITTRFVIALVATVSWWFVLVLAVKHQVLPVEALTAAADRENTGAISLHLSAWALLAGFAISWAVVVAVRKRDPHVRLLVIAFVALLPAAAIAWAKGFAIRQFAPIVLLSCIALGVAVAELVRLMAGAVREHRSSRAATAILVCLAVLGCGLALVPVLGTQGAAVPGSPKDLDRNIAAWLRPRLHTGDDVIATTLRFQEQIAARLNGSATVVDVPFKTSRSAPKLADAVLVDWAAGKYRWVPAGTFAPLLRRSDWLVLSGRDPRLNAAPLARWLQLDGAKLGIDARRIYNPSFRGAWGTVFSVRHARVREIPTIVTVEATTHLLRSHRFVVQRPTAIAGSPEDLARLTGKLPTRPDLGTIVMPPDYRP
jgi:hypothetical protein